MNFNFPEKLDPEEYQFGDKIDDKKFSKSIRTISHINYRYIDLEKTEYNFRQSCFDNKDVVEYFDFMSMLCDNSFDYLLNNKRPDWHLNPNDYHKEYRFKELVNKALNISEDLAQQNIPSFFHFALYTDSTGKANRKTGIKSPRIYFFIGDNAVIYPLFYDPYHEINPLSQ